MSTRDTTPYVEHTDTLPSGTRLHAIHNLTDQDVDLIRGMLRNARANITTIMQHAPIHAPIHTGLQREAKQLDHLILHLYPKR